MLLRTHRGCCRDRTRQPFRFVSSDSSSSTIHSSLREWPGLRFTERIEGAPLYCSLQAHLLSLQGRGLIDLPLRATFSPAHPLARRDVPLARARASCYVLLNITLSLSRESPDYPLLRASDEHRFIVRVLRARRMVWRLPILPSEAARCASTEDHQAPSPSPIPTAPRRPTTSLRPSRPAAPTRPSASICSIIRAARG